MIIFWGIEGGQEENSFDFDDRNILNGDVWFIREGKQILAYYKAVEQTQVIRMLMWFIVVQSLESTCKQGLENWIMIIEQKAQAKVKMYLIKMMEGEVLSQR